MFTTVKQLFDKPPVEEISGVRVSGWVRTVRDSKAFAFIALNDGTCFKPCRSWSKRPTYPTIKKSPS